MRTWKLVDVHDADPIRMSAAPVGSSQAGDVDIPNGVVVLRLPIRRVGTLVYPARRADRVLPRPIVGL